MRFLHILFFVVHSLSAQSSLLEKFEETLKAGQYLEFNFEYNKTGLYSKETGKGTLLLKSDGDFVLEVPFGKSSKYTVKFENDMFFELIAQDSKYSYNIYKEPTQLHIAFIIDLLKKIPKGASAVLSSLEKDYTIKSMHDKISIKSKTEDAILLSAEIREQDKKTLFSFIFRPDIESKRTETIEVVTQRNEAVAPGSALRFILNVPKNAIVALTE